MDKEIRYYESDVEVRDDSREINGRAVVFDKLSRNLGWFREKIDPHAFDECDMTDVIACRNHDPDKVMARTTADTLDLNTDAQGLNYKFEAPNTTAGNDTLEDIKLKNIQYSSFAFTIAEDRWDEDDEHGEVRTILRIKKLYDVSPVTNPAYFGTDVQANGLEVAQRSHDEWKAAQKLIELNEANKGEGKDLTEGGLAGEDDPNDDMAKRKDWRDASIVLKKISLR